MDMEKLTDAEVAFLTYACESKHESIRKNSYATPELVAAGGKLRNLFCVDYDKRKLHWKQFLPED